MYKRLSITAGLVLILFSFVFLSCNKSSDIGLDLIPDKFLFESSSQDTFTVIAYTYPVDSFQTSGMSKGLIGSYLDPVFGETKASFVTEIRSSAKFNKNYNPVFDSIVMYLKYDTTVVYGDRSVEHELNIYEITESLDDSLYYNDFDLTTLNPKPLITSKTFRPIDLKDDTITVWKEKFINTLAIKLDGSFVQQLYDDIPKWSDTTFRTYFKGFLIKSNETAIDGSITAFDLADVNSRVSIYYKNDSIDSLRYDFTFRNNCKKFNVVEHNYNAPGFLADLEDPESVQDTIVYIQGLAGLEVKILFPYLDEIKKQGLYAVNRAELYVQTESEAITDEGNFPAPKSLIIGSLDEDGKFNPLSEYLSSTGYVGVKYNDGNYIFDLTNTIQRIIKGDIENYGFKIKISDAAYNPSRAVFTSGNNSKRMRLVLSITKL